MRGASKPVFILLFALVVGCQKQEPIPQPTPDVTNMTIAEIQAAMAAGELTSEQLVQQALKAAANNEGLNALISLRPDDALDRARELDARVARGERPGALHGMPMVVKDNIHVAGMPNTAGTPGLREFMPAKDSPVVAALRDAGAIVIGKANMHELAFGITSDNAAFGSVDNPAAPGMIPGGSSGGTAAAIAAGITSIGLGTDTGGSARIPAALTGIVGFRPSSGRYAQAGVTPISSTRDTIGLMARSVADIRLVDAVIAPEAEVMMILEPPGLRIGVDRGFFFANLDEASVPVIEAALERIQAAGVELIDAEVPHLEALLAQSAFPIALYEVVRDMEAYLEAYDTGTDLPELAAAAASPDVQGIFGLVMGDGAISEEVYQKALAARQQLVEIYADYFDSNELDAMLLPTTLLPARPIEGSLETVDLNGEQVPTFPTYIHNTDPASIAGVPGLSLPAGTTARGSRWAWSWTDRQAPIGACWRSAWPWRRSSAGRLWRINHALGVVL